MSIFGFALVALGLLLGWAGMKQVLWTDVLKSLFANPVNAPTTPKKGP